VATEPAPPAPVEPAPPAEPGVIDAAALRRVWDEVLGYVGRSSKRIAALARDAVVREVEGSTVVLTLKSAPLAAMLTSDEALLTQAITEVVGGTWRIRCDISGQSSNQSSQALPAPAPRAARPSADAPRPSAEAARPAAPAPAADEDWPTPARLGGGTVATAPPQTPPAAVPDPRPARASRPAKAAPRKPAADKTPPAAETAWSDGPPPGEPPFDPDYDAPGGGLGFDPGDEPADDEPEAVRETSEQQALRLLTEELGAEKIGETEH